MLTHFILSQTQFLSTSKRHKYSASKSYPFILAEWKLFQMSPKNKIKINEFWSKFCFLRADEALSANMQNHYLEMLSTSGLQHFQTLSQTPIAGSLDPFGLVIYSFHLEKIICKSCFLALLVQQSSCRSDFPPKKTCKLTASQSRENRTNRY